jgi:ribonucleoside-diphosphate reductase alpha chain
MSARQCLPNRRLHELATFEFNGLQFVGGVGRFPNGEIAELFINGAKFGSAAEASAQEAALCASLALQHGCRLSTIRHALTAKGVAGGPLGALLLSLD